MNIAYILPEFVTEKEAGGLATYYDNISRLLADAGHNIRIFVRSDRDEKFWYYPNVMVERVFTDLSNVNAKIPGSFIREWSLKLKERLVLSLEMGEMIDLVQYPNFMGFGIERIDLPTVIRISSYLPLLRAADKEYFDIRGVYDSIKVPDFIEEMALLKADAVYGPGKSLIEFLSKRTGRKMQVIESPFYPKRDMSGMSTVYKGILKGKRYILTFGTLKALKGAKLIGDCIYKILQACPHIIWVFAGAECAWIDENTGEKTVPSEYIKDHAAEYQNRVLYLGKLEQCELYDIIKNADACVMPSRVDNLPNTCIEAMALGKVVIGTEGASFEQLIKDKVSGFLVERENSRMLVQTVISVCHMQEEQKMAMGERAKDRIREMKPQKILHELLDLYKSVIDSFHGQENMENNAYYQQLVKKYNEAMFGTQISEAEKYIIQNRD